MGRTYVHNNEVVADVLLTYISTFTCKIETNSHKAHNVLRPPKTATYGQPRSARRVLKTAPLPRPSVPGVLHRHLRPMQLLSRPPAAPLGAVPAVFQNSPLVALPPAGISGARAGGARRRAECQWVGRQGVASRVHGDAWTAGCAHAHHLEIGRFAPLKEPGKAAPWGRGLGVRPALVFLF
jgi:hypothetical protein